MKRLDTFYVANTVPYISARISISYYLSEFPIKPGSSKHYRTPDKLYIRLGNLVVLMSRSPKESVVVTLRRMLIVLALYPKFLELAPSDNSVYILSAWVTRFLNVNYPKYMKLPLKTLYEEALLSMARIRSLTSGARITLTSIPDAKVTLLNLNTAVLSLIRCTPTYERYSRMQKTRKNSRLPLRHYLSSFRALIR